MAKIKVVVQKIETAEIEIEVMDAVVESACQSALKANPYGMVQNHPELAWDTEAPQYKIKEVVPC